MMEIEGIAFEIEEVRKQLNNLINEKRKFTDVKVIETSQKLDKLINIYNSSFQNLDYQHSDNI